MLRKPEDKKDWQKDVLPSIEETSEPIIAEVKGKVIKEPVLKATAPNKPVARKTAKKTTKKAIEKMDV